MDQYIGKMLDNRYEILERIGTGGMAVVYKAKCHRLNRLVAIKILKADLAQDADFRRRFNAESQAVAQLSHPNIVSVYDVSRGGDTEYIVMELIDGITLKQYMEKRGQLNWRESLHFITQIMRGLSHAHSRGVIHRDIKPQNIMILRDGSVKVADFGIACLENSAQTLTQEALGSVHYISPEQARGERTDPRSDIYSAGVVLYEMLTGRLPFEGDSAVSVAIQHLSSIPLPPREIRSDIPEQMELICMRAMAADPDKRYPSADAMIADLEAFRKNPGVSLDFEMKDLRTEEVDEPTRLLRTGAAAAASHPAASRPSRPARESREYETEEAPQRGSKKRTVVIAVAAVAAVIVIFFLFRGIFSSFGGHTQEYEVQNVVGYTVEQAGQLAGVKDVFEIQEAGSEASEDVPAGVILRQDPEAGRRTKSLTIKVWVSSGVESGEMPDVTGKDVRIARQELKDLIKDYDLELLDDQEEFSDDVDEGCVISSSPKAGEALKKGDTIQLTVSKGPESYDVPVPSFLTQNIDKVRSEIKSVWNLEMGKVTEVPSDKEAGTVVGQSVDPSTVVPSGTVIDFDVSAGPDETENSVTVDCTLPTDRDSVHLTVTVDGETQYDRTVNCGDEYIRVTLTGKGTRKVVVYWDGEEQERYDLQFSD